MSTRGKTTDTKVKYLPKKEKKKSLFYLRFRLETSSLKLLSFISRRHNCSVPVRSVRPEILPAIRAGSAGIKILSSPVLRTICLPSRSCLRLRRLQLLPGSNDRFFFFGVKCFFARPRLIDYACSPSCTYINVLHLYKGFALFYLSLFLFIFIPPS